jgi:hypothetical protein
MTWTKRTKPTTPFTEIARSSHWELGYWLLNEDGSYILNEDGSRIVLEEAPEIFSDRTEPDTDWSKLL